jgi:hypothetical protein
MSTYRLFAIACFVFFSSQQCKAQVFNEVASDLGIASSALSEYGNGISLYDWNVDGFDDLVILNEDSFPRFFQNNQGVFQEVFFPDLQFHARFRSVCWIDFNNDGNLDIGFNTQYDGYFLFRNNGDFNFENITQSAGIPPQLSDSYAQCWGDYNRDGFIDLYIPYYEDGNQPSASRNLLYKNNGDGTFSDVTGMAGVDDGYAKSLISVWFDYDNDLWPDLFVLNDRVSFDNHLYKNNRDGTFTDVSAEAGVLYAIESMSGTVGDMNNDGNLDVYITNSAIGPSLLHRNRGDGTFDEVGTDYNVQLYQGGWSAVWIDYDNNMLQDLFVATQPVPGDNYLFRNIETSFEIDNNSGLFGQSLTFAAALGDINNDGAPDLVSFSSAPGGLEIWENNGTLNNYLKIKLRGVESNREAIGSWIEVITPDGTHQYRYSLCGENFISQNSQWMQIGMGQNDFADTIRVRWINGMVEEYYNVPVNQNLIYQEGATLNNLIAYSGTGVVCAGDSLLIQAGNWDSYLWSTGDTTSSIYAHPGNSYFVTTYNGPFEVISDAISIELELMPQLEEQVQHVSCYDGSDGLIQLLITPQPASINWPSINMSGTTVTNLAEGTYQYFIESALGCSFSGLVSVNQADSIQLQIFEIPNIPTQDCESDFLFHVSSSGGTGDLVLSWFLHDDINAAPVAAGFFNNELACISGTDEESYIVVSVIDENSCFKRDTFLVQNIELSLENSNSSNSFISSYPNPVKNEVFIEGISPGANYKVYSSTGELLEVVSSYNSVKEILTIRTGAFAPGVYHVFIESDSEVASIRFIKN